MTDFNNTQQSVFDYESLKKFFEFLEKEKRCGKKVIMKPNAVRIDYDRNGNPVLWGFVEV